MFHLLFYNQFYLSQGALLTLENNIFSRYQYFIYNTNYINDGSVITIDNNVLEDMSMYFIHNMYLSGSDTDGSPSRLIITNNNISGNNIGIDSMVDQNVAGDEYGIIMKDNIFWQSRC